MALNVGLCRAVYARTFAQLMVQNVLFSQHGLVSFSLIGQNGFLGPRILYEIIRLKTHTSPHSNVEPIR